MKNLPYIGLLIALIPSCKNNEPINPTDYSQKSDYLPLEIGNYWVYRHFEIDEQGNETEMSEIDSVVISRDTIINNSRYYVLEGTNYPINEGRWGIIDILRDSSDYLVNEIGTIEFAKNNFSDILASKIEVLNGDTLYSLSYKMEKSVSPIAVPAGTFNVLNFQGTLITNQNLFNTENPRFINNYYAEKVGKIIETYFFINSPVIHEKKLIRYNVGL